MKIAFHTILIAILLAPFTAMAISLATHDLHPYGSYHQGRFEGVAVDVVRCAFNAMGEPIELKVVPWARAEDMARKGIVDGFFAASKNDERERFGISSVKIADQKWVWFHRKDIKLSDEKMRESCQKDCLSAASFLGANMHKWLVENKYRVVDPPGTTQALVERVFHGDINVGLANNYVLDSIISEKKYRDQFSISVLRDSPLFLYFNRSFIQARPDFLERYNLATNKCLNRAGP